MENLIDVLDSENAAYEKVAALSESKTSAIVAGDIENLGKIMEEEQEIVGKIQGMEKPGMVVEALFQEMEIPFDPAWSAVTREDTYLNRGTEEEPLFAPMDMQGA